MTTMPERGKESPTVDVWMAERRPALPMTPEPARRVNFLKGCLLYWILPRRYGPHLAAGGWMRAVGAHAISSLLSSFLILFSGAFSQFGNANTAYSLRTRLAMVILDTASETTRYRWGSSDMALLGFACVFEVAMVGLAILLMPWCAGGDSPGSVFKRSLKHVYWSTTIAVPISITYVMLIMNGAKLEHLLDFPSRTQDAWAALLAAFFIAATIRLLLNGVWRYVGTAASPDLETSIVQCENCGYSLQGLPLHSQCPECGRSIGASISTERELLAGRATGKLGWNIGREFLRRQWWIIHRRDSLDRLPMREGTRSARRFWWRTYSLWMVFAAVVFSLYLLWEGRYGEQDSVVVGKGFATFVVPIALQVFMMAAACLWGHLRHGIRDYSVSAMVSWYASPLMAPLMMAFVLLIPLGLPGGKQWLNKSWLPTAAHFGFDAPSLVCLAMVFAAGAWTIIWWRRLCRGLVNNQFANM